MGVIVSNHDFTRGELDPSLFARSDLVFYNKAAKTCKNFIVLPGGGVKKRFGTTLFDDVALTAGSDHFQLFSWRTEEKDFLIIVTNINAAGLLVVDISVSPFVVSTFTNPYHADVSSRTVRGAQNQNEFVLTSGPVGILQIIFDPTAGTVSTSTYSFKNPPVHDFDNNYDDWTFEVSPVEVTVGTAYSTLTCTAGTGWGGLTADYVGGVFEALGPTTSTTIGRARIISVNVPAQTADIQVITPFAQTSAGPPTVGSFPGTQCFIAQPAYSAHLGWPRTISFFEDRLVLAGSQSLPQSIFLSATGDFRDFDTGTGLASDSIAYSIASGSQDAIRNVVSSRTLQIFTNSSEMSTPAADSQGATPSNFSIRAQTNNGSELCTPVVLDNSTLYIKKGGRAVMAYNYDYTVEAYNSSDASLLSSHLIKNPIDMSAYTENTTFDANILIGIDEDFNLFLYETYVEQNVAAWSSTATKEGSWRNVCAVGGSVFFITLRNSTYHLEELTWERCLDFTSSYTPAASGEATIPCGATYANMTVDIVTDVEVLPDGANQATYIGTSETDGSGDTLLSFPLDSTKTYIFGYGIDSTLETMPAHIMSQAGDTLYTKKTIYKVYIDFMNSYPFKANDVEIPMSHLYTPESGGILLDDPVPPVSGIFALPTNITGWGRRVSATCESDKPLPLTIRGVAVEISV